MGSKSLFLVYDIIRLKYTHIHLFLFKLEFLLPDQRKVIFLNEGLPRSISFLQYVKLSYTETECLIYLRSFYTELFGTYPMK